jgi:hypothetical protein
LVDTLGPYPEGRPERRLWQETAGDIAAWRDGHGVTDQTNPLGPTPDTIGRNQHRQLARRLDRTARRLGHHLAPSFNTDSVSNTTEASTLACEHQKELYRDF